MDAHPTGSEAFDELLRGGFEKGIITTIYGPSGSGKSNLTLLATATNEQKTVFVDTEGSFSVDRLEHFAFDAEKALKNVILLAATSFEQQTKIITQLSKLVTEDVSLVIVDGIAAQYRAAMARSEENLNNQLSEQINALFAVAAENNIPVVITSQVYADMEGDGVKVVGGDIVKYNSKCLLELQNDEGHVAIIRKHRFLPEGTSKRFVIDAVGIYEEK
ncbi:MAG: DNA repair and recombination protein RadB [Candidatus Woesearchaeota archaeon]